MSVTLSWDDFWAWYTGSEITDMTRKDIITQLDLKRLLRTLAEKERVKVLANAPKYIKQWVGYLPQTQTAIPVNTTAGIVERILNETKKQRNAA